MVAFARTRRELGWKLNQLLAGSGLSRTNGLGGLAWPPTEPELVSAESERPARNGRRACLIVGTISASALPARVGPLQVA